MLRFIIMTASAKVSASRRRYGPYKYAAILELDPLWVARQRLLGLTTTPKMISERARGVKRIVEMTPALWAGGNTHKSAWVRRYAELEKRCAELNEERPK